VDVRHNGFRAKPTKQFNAGVGNFCVSLGRNMTAIRKMHAQFKFVAARCPDVKPTSAHSQMSDLELIEECQKKSQKAFCQLIKRHERAVYSTLYRLAPDWKDQISDLSQEVFIRAWRSMNTLRNPHAFRAWLSHITTNLFYDELRKRPKYLVISLEQHFHADEDGATRDIVDNSALPDELAELKNLSEDIHKAITKLPEAFRSAFALRELDGLSYGEIATITDAQIGTVKSRIARARCKLQQSLLPQLQVQN
jgi:RNA polymerase sigma-70 factor (ECF subfamily)